MASLLDLLNGGVSLEGTPVESTEPSKMAQLLRSVARGVPQAATGFVDLAALPLTLSGLIDSKDVVGSTDYLTKKGLLPQPQKGLTNQTAELLAGGLMPLSPAAMRQTIQGAKSLAPKLYDAAEDYMTKTGGMQWAYQPNTPQKPNPMVGKTYETENLGNLANKTVVPFENLKGSSALIMPWDSTSRNVKVNSISGEKLPTPVTTHGGQDYARDLEHIQKGVAGASNLGIAKRIKDRDAMARIENEMAGGTGQVVHFPTTMGAGAENFSVMPTEAMLQLLDLREPSKKFTNEIDQHIRDIVITKYKKDKTPVKTQPFKNFAGMMSEEGRMQLYNGEGLGTTAGELRKAFIQQMSKKNRGFEGGNNQKYMNYNHEDLVNALLDPSLIGVGKGYIGNTVIGVGEGGMHLKPSKNATYNTDFTGNYMGTLGENVPVEAIFPTVFGDLSKKFAKKTGDLRNNVLGAMEKRKSGVSEFIDDEAIDNYYKFLQERKKMLERGE